MAKQNITVKTNTVNKKTNLTTKTAKTAKITKQKSKPNSVGKQKNTSKKIEDEPVNKSDSETNSDASESDVS